MGDMMTMILMLKAVRDKGVDCGKRGRGGRVGIWISFEMSINRFLSDVWKVSFGHIRGLGFVET